MGMKKAEIFLSLYTYTHFYYEKPSLILSAGSDVTVNKSIHRICALINQRFLFLFNVFFWAFPNRYRT